MRLHETGVRLFEIDVRLDDTDTVLHENNQKPTEDSQGSAFGLVRGQKSETDVRRYEIGGKQVSRATYFRRRKDQERIERERSAVFNLVYDMQAECKEIDAQDSSGSIHDDNSPFALRRSVQVEKIIQVYTILHPKQRPLTPDMAKTYLAHNNNSCWSVISSMLDMWEYLETHLREDGSKHNYPTYYRQVFKERSTGLSDVG